MNLFVQNFCFVHKSQKKVRKKWYFSEDACLVNNIFFKMSRFSRSLVGHPRNSPLYILDSLFRLIMYSNSIIFNNWIAH